MQGGAAQAWGKNVPEARARAPYSAPCTLPCSCSAALHDLMEEIVGKDMLPAAGTMEQGQRDN